MSTGIAHVDKKYVNYEYIEQRILVLQNFNTSLTKGQRCYFGANTRLKGKRIVGIETLGLGDLLNPVIINGVPILHAAGYIDVTVSIVNPLTNEDLIYQYPGTDLLDAASIFATKGISRAPRIFDLDVDHDIERSYVQTTVSGARVYGLIFNFYTVPW